MRITINTTSTIPAPADQVWQRIGGPEGINDELWPVMKMTIPQGLAAANIDNVKLGTPIGRSRLLLFGRLPIGYDDVTIMKMNPGHSFLEVSPMSGFRHWEHERVVEPRGGSCELRDRISFEPAGLAAKIPGMSRLYRWTFTRFFRHRHNRVIRHFTLAKTVGGSSSDMRSHAGAGRPAMTGE